MSVTVAKTGKFAILHSVAISTMVMLLCVPSDINKVPGTAVTVT